MTKFRRLVAILSMVSVLSMLVVSTTAFADYFGDVTPDQYWYTHVEDLGDQGVVDTDNLNFEPTRQVNRAEFAAMVCAAAGLTYTVPATPTFSDVSADDWFFEPLECAYQNGVMSGYSHAPGTVGPGDPVTREQAAKMIVEGFDLPEFLPADRTFPDVNDPMWSWPFVETAYHWSVVNGYSNGDFGPMDNIIRGDASVMLVQAQNPVERDGVCPAGEYLVDEVCVPMPSGGDFTVSLASDTPPTQASIPAGATGVSVAKFNFTGGDNDVVLNSLTLQRVGVGVTTDFSKVYLYKDGAKLGNGKTVNSSTNEVLFNNVGVSVGAGETVALEVRVDLAVPIGNAGVHAFQVTNADAVDSTAAAVLGNFPVKANDFGTSTVAVGSVDVESPGTDYTRKVGEQDVIIGRFSVFVGNTEDALLKGITLYNDDDDVLSNLVLWRGSEVVAEGVKNGRYFTFMFDTPLPITKGESLSFDVKGDIGGKNADTAQLYVRYNTDVMVEGQTYGYNMYVDATLNETQTYVDEAATTAAYTVRDNVTTVEAGQVTVSFNGPAATDVSKNSNNVRLMNFTLTSQANLDVEKMTVNLSGTGLATTDIDDLDVYCDGVLVANISAPLVADNAFTDVWSVAAGETVDCYVEVDVSNHTSVITGDEIIATLKDLTDTTEWTLRDSDTNDTITDIVPSGDIVGNTMSVTLASLDVEVSSNPATGNTFVKGSKDVEVVGLLFTAGSSSDVTINSVKLTAYLDDDQNAFADAADKNAASGAQNIMSSVKIYDKATMDDFGKTAKSLTVGTTDVSVTFDTLNWMIPAGESRILLVKTNLSTSAPTGGTGSDDFTFAIAAAGDVDAEYGTGTALTTTLSNGNTTPSVYQTVTGNGLLGVQLYTDTPEASLFEGSSSNVATQVKFLTNDREAFEINKLRVNATATAKGDVASVTVGYWDEADAWRESTKSLVGTASPYNADFTFSSPTPANDHPIWVPKNGNTIIDFVANLNSVGSGATNKDTVKLGFDWNDGFEAYGASSSSKIVNAGLYIEDLTTLLSVGAVDVAPAYNHTIYKSYPTVAFTDDTPKGNFIPSGNLELGYVNISAGPADLTFDLADSNYLIFNIASSCTGGGCDANVDDNFVLKDGSTTLSTVAVNVGTSTSVTFPFETNTLTVPANTTKKLKVFGDVTDLTAVGNSIQLSLQDTAANIDWGIDGVSNTYQHGDIIFKGDLYGGALIKP